MMTKEQVETVLVLRIMAATESCNSYHINHVIGQVRALAAVLTGKRPPVFETIDEALEFVGLPFTEVDGVIEIDRPWLLERGFIVTEKSVTHPGFQAW